MLQIAVHSTELSPAEGWIDLVARNARNIMHSLDSPEQEYLPPPRLDTKQSMHKLSSEKHGVSGQVSLECDASQIFPLELFQCTTLCSFAHTICSSCIYAAFTRFSTHTTSTTPGQVYDMPATTNQVL